MNVYGQLTRAQLEPRTSDHATTLVGALWYDTAAGFVKIADGSLVKKFLLNDDKIIIGTSGTASTNVREYRAGTALLQFVPGNVTTAEGTLSTTLAQISARAENYTTAGRPNFGNAGRVIYNTDDLELQVDTGSSWVSAGGGGGSDNFELLRKKFHDELYGVITPSMAYAFGSGFGLPDAEPEGQIIEDYTAGTSVAVVWNPIYLNDSDKNCNTTTNWSIENAATNLGTSGTFKIGTAAVSFDKDNSDTNAQIVYDRGAVDLGVAGFTELFFWINLPSITQLANVTAVVDIDGANYETYTTTTNSSGGALAVGWNLIKFDLTQAGVSTGTGWTYDLAFQYLHVGVNTSASAQTYTAILIDAIRFSQYNPASVVFTGNVYSINDTSNLANFQIDAASPRVSGIVTLTSALGVAFDGGTDSQVRRNTLSITGNGQAIMEEGLSGDVSTSQVVRSQAVYDVSVTKTYRGFADVNTPLAFEVTDVNSTTQIEVSSVTDWSAEIVSGAVLHVFRFKNGQYVRRATSPGDLTVTSSSWSGGILTINTSGSNSGISATDWVVFKHISARISVVSIDANENFQTPTLEKVLFENVGLAFPFAQDTWAYYPLSLPDFTATRYGTGNIDLTLTGALSSVSALNGQFGATGFSATDYLSATYADSLPISGATSEGTGLIVSYWFNAHAAAGGNETHIGRWTNASGGRGWRVLRTVSQDIFAEGDNSVAASFGTPALNTWNHVVISIENGGATYKAWLNGVLGLNAAQTVTDNAGSAFYIGIDILANFAGDTDFYQVDIIKDQAATQGMVDSLYNGGSGRILGVSGFVSYQYSLPGTAGQKGTWETTVARTTDAVSVFLGAHGALTVS